MKNVQSVDLGNSLVHHKLNRAVYACVVPADKRAECLFKNASYANSTFVISVYCIFPAISELYFFYLNLRSQSEKLHVYLFFSQIFRNNLNCFYTFYEIDKLNI